MPVISTIVPVYNGKATIQSTIESVLAQTFRDFELIVINDGSTDKTLEILEQIDDARLSVFSYPNAGLATSRNRGIDRARGEYLAFLDADDLWTPDKLELQLKALQDAPDAAVAYSWTDYIDERDRVVKAGKRVAIEGNVLEKLLLENFLENGSNPLIRKEALKEIGGFDPLINSAADWDLYLRLAKRYAFVAVPQPQILYRLTASSMSANIDRQERECLIVIDRAFQDLPELQRNLKNKSIASLYKYLTFKALDGDPSPQNGIASARCLSQYIRYKPSLIKQPRVILGAASKITKMLMTSVKNKSNTEK